MIKICVTFYVIRFFRGQNEYNFGPLHLENEKAFEKHYCKKVGQNNALNNMKLSFSSKKGLLGNYEFNP